MAELDYISVFNALGSQGFEFYFCLGAHDLGSVGRIEVNEYKFHVAWEEDGCMKFTNRLMLQLDITFLMIAQNKGILLI